MNLRESLKVAQEVQYENCDRSILVDIYWYDNEKGVYHILDVTIKTSEGVFESVKDYDYESTADFREAIHKLLEL